MKKILALLLALVMVMALAACGGGSAPAEETAPEAPAEEPAAAPEAPEAPVEEPAAEAGDDFAEYKVYFGEYAAAGAPNDEERANMASLIEACESFADIEAIPQSTILFEAVGVLTYDAWLAAGKPAAETEGMGSEADNQASGEPSGEPSDEPAAEAGDASGEPSDAPEPPPSGDGAIFPIPEDLPAGLSVEEAYVEYVRAFLAAELEVNNNMTVEQVENEFIPNVQAGNYDQFPVDMLYGGMLATGTAMTFDEFAAQY